MKLNQKGYMLVEIVLASVLAMTIAYYLLNLTYKFKNTNEDIYQSITYMKDKITITKNIMNDIERGIVSNIKVSDNKKNVTFHLTIDGSRELRQLSISTELGITTITYGKIDENGIFNTEDVSYYTKSLEKSLMVSEPIIERKEASFSIVIPIKALYTDKNYDIRILTPEYHFTPFPLSEVKIGSYVEYEGNNGCPEGHCNGTNANYENDTNKGYCYNSKHKFPVNGWRVGYIEDKSAYLVSAGSPECLRLNTVSGEYLENVSTSTSEISVGDGMYYYGSDYEFNPSTGQYTLTGTMKQLVYQGSIFSDTPYTCKSTLSSESCDIMYKLDNNVGIDTSQIRFNANVYIYTKKSSIVNYLNEKALTYCNKDYAFNNSCDSNSVWAMNEIDFQNTIGNKRTFDSCRDQVKINECGYGNDIIDNNNYYWFANEARNVYEVYHWYPDSGIKAREGSYGDSYGLRPVIRLNSTVMVTGGTGTEKDPYIISGS